MEPVNTIGLVIEDLRGHSAQRGEHQVLQQAVAVGEDAGADRGHQGVVDAVDPAGIDADPGRRAGKDVHAEQQPVVFEGDEPIDHRAFAHPVAEGFQVVGQVTDGVVGAGIVHQPVGQIDHRPRVGDVVVPDDAGEDGVPVRLMGFDALLPVESVDAGEAADLPVVLDACLSSSGVKSSPKAITVPGPSIQIYPIDAQVLTSFDPPFVKIPRSK